MSHNHRCGIFVRCKTVPRGDWNGRSWPGVSCYVEPRHVFFVWVDRVFALRLVGSDYQQECSLFKNPLISPTFPGPLHQHCGWSGGVQLHLRPSRKLPKISCRIQAILGMAHPQVWAFMDFRHEALDLPEESGKQGTEVETSEVLFWVYKSVRFCGKLIAKVLFGQIKVRQDDSKRWRSFWSLYVDPEHR